MTCDSRIFNIMPTGKVIDVYDDMPPDFPVLMQYTGLKDKNGREIYEGDILKRTVHIVIYGSETPPEDVDEYLDVKWYEEYAGFYIGERPLYAFVGAKFDCDTQCRCTDVEVSGNIHENPELLKEG
jgi:uncharacterized phage protein (TIGR01671 family)